MPTLAIAAGTSTLVKAGSGVLKKFAVTTSGAAGTINDAATTGAAAAANVLCATPAAIVVQEFVNGWKFQNGLVVAPGAAQVVTVDFE